LPSARRLKRESLPSARRLKPERWLSARRLKRGVEKRQDCPHGLDIVPCRRTDPNGHNGPFRVMWRDEQLITPPEP
jgi:hypothetical protein